MKLEVIQWTRGDETITVINGRDLHKALDPGRDMPTWIKSRVEGYGYIEGDDFTSYLVERGTATPAREYLLTLPMAAELCLLDRSDHGRNLRQQILTLKAPHICLCNKACGEQPILEISKSDAKPVIKAETAWIECLIDRDGDTTLTIPGSYGSVITFRKNKFGHSVCRIDDPTHRANILRSIFYRSYIEPV